MGQQALIRSGFSRYHSCCTDGSNGRDWYSLVSRCNWGVKCWKVATQYLLSHTGELSSVLEAFVTDSIGITSTKRLWRILPMSADDSIALQTDATLVGAFNGSSSSTISLNTFCNALFGEGTASAQLTTLLFSGIGTLTAVGMGWGDYGDRRWNTYSSTDLGIQQQNNHQHRYW